MVIWITGRAGAGKTTLAHALAGGNPRAVVLDGDEVRKHFAAGFDDASRWRHIERIARMAALLEEQGFTSVVACVSPKAGWRAAARKLLRESLLIYLPGGHLWKGTEYEEPGPDELRLWRMT